MMATGGFGGVAGSSAGSAGASASGGSGEGGGSGAAASSPLGAHCVGCTAVPIGTPTWSLAGAVMAAGSIGSGSDPQPFTDWISAIVSPNHRSYPAESLFGPGTPHPAPYDDEAFVSFTKAGISAKQSFTTAEFTEPSGIVFTLNVVPSAAAAVGSSVDFASGPIIPNALFPLAIDGDLYRDLTLYDPAFDSSYPGYNAFDPPIIADGASHVPLWFGENSSFIPGVAPEGKYDFKISVRDASGSGWMVDLPFVVASPCDDCTSAGAGGAADTGAGGSGASNPSGGVGSLSSDG